MKKIYYLLYIMIIFLFSIGVTYGNIFKCINENGFTYYKDKPCPTTDTETVIKAVKDPKKSYVPSYTYVESEGITTTDELELTMRGQKNINKKQIPYNQTFNHDLFANKNDKVNKNQKETTLLSSRSIKSTSPVTTVNSQSTDLIENIDILEPPH